MILGFLFVRTVPPGASSALHKVDGDRTYTIIPPPPHVRRRSSDFELTRSEDGLAENSHERDSRAPRPRASRSPDHIYDRARSPTSFDLPASDFGAASPGTIQPPHYLHDLEGIEEDTSLRDDITERSVSSLVEVADQIDIHGRALFASLDFWLLFLIVSLRACSTPFAPVFQI